MNASEKMLPNSHKFERAPKQQNEKKKKLNIKIEICIVKWDASHSAPKWDGIDGRKMSASDKRETTRTTT